MSQTSPQKPINSPGEPDITGLLNHLALALLVEHAGGSITFPMAEIDRIAAETNGINTVVTNTQIIGIDRYLILNLIPKEGTSIIQ